MIDLEGLNPDVRHLEDLESVLLDTDWYSEFGDVDGDRGVYFMYRDLSETEGDKELMESLDLRYDITVIPGFQMGREFVKTLGHDHPDVPGQGLTYTEVYEVLEGEAVYLLQENRDERVERVVCVKAASGDQVVIPPNYGHLTINPSSGDLKMANWVSSAFSSDYSIYKKKRGGGYYYLVDGTLVKNPNYEDLPVVEWLNPKPISRHLMYTLIRDDPDMLDFLNHPQDHLEFFEGLG